MSLQTSNMTPSELLQLNLNDSTLDLLNAAIASHQSKVENVNNEILDNETAVQVNTKRELEKDEQTSTTAPKRAGRKPLDKSQIPDGPLDPKQKRKAQNRAAQRAFRDRKEKHVSELQARIDELEKLNESKDQELIEENKRLKEVLQKLQEENYALKGAQFTFEFPLIDPFQTPTNTTLIASSPTNGSMFNTTSSFNSEDTGSSIEQSPSHTLEDDSTSAAETPVPLSVDPTQFGLLPALSTNQNLDFLAVADSTSNPIPNDAILTGDLFHGKDDLFSSFREPNNNGDDFLFANEDLTSLFGATDDLFSGFNSSLNAQFGLPETPATRRVKCPQEKKDIMMDKLKQNDNYVCGTNASYSDFNLDLLCNEMKQKAQCSMRNYPITDHEVNAFMQCLERN